jgi:hypothetical protein
MNWLLSKNKTKQPRPKKSREKPAIHWDPQRTLQGLKILGAAVLVFGVIAGWRFMDNHMSGYLGSRVPPVMTPEKVILVHPPAWMSPLLQEYLKSLAAQELNSKPMEHQSLNQVVAVFAANPWVEHVHRVQRVSQGHVQVYAEYRQPIAVAQIGDWFIPVDAKGIRLPGAYTAQQLNPIGLPVIIGLANAPKQEGEPWPGADLNAGLSLVKFLAQEPYLDQVVAFDVSARDPRGRLWLSLRTDQGVVRWGLPPGMEQSIEPRAETKRYWLRSVFEQKGNIDAGGKIVDLFGAAVFVHQPYFDQPNIVSATYVKSR